MNSFNKKTARLYRIAAVIIIILVLASFCTAVYAYLKSEGGNAKNTFSAADEADPAIAETYNGTLKTDVYVDVGDIGYSVYVRAVIVAVWKDAEGNVLSVTPKAGVDYYIRTASSDWFLYNGCYYYSSSVESGGSTSVLIEECRLITEPPQAGCRLEVKIAAQTIQAAGATDGTDIPAVQAEWGVNVNSEKKLEAPLE